MQLSHFKLLSCLLGKTKGWHYYGQNDPRPRLVITVTNLFVYFLPVLHDAGIEKEEFMYEMFVLITGRMNG